MARLSLQVGSKISIVKKYNINVFCYIDNASYRQTDGQTETFSHLLVTHRQSLVYIEFICQLFTLKNTKNFLLHLKKKLNVHLKTRLLPYFFNLNFIAIKFVLRLIKMMGNFA